jgi:hypothetical protein
MVWDLRRAMLAKEEFGSGRLTDFEFREMVRALKLVAAELGMETKPMLNDLADHGEEAALDRLAEHAVSRAHVDALYGKAHAEARRQLIAERGDPTPYRLG